MGTDWIECLDKKPTDRTGHDLDLIFSKLKDIKVFENFHPMLLQQLCYYGYYENLDKGVTLFRHGDVGTNWYVCLSGSVEVVLPTGNNKNNHSVVCTLGAGSAFGESIIYDTIRNATIITSDICELLRVEQKDFRILWAKNREYMNGVISSLSRFSLNDHDLNIRFSEFNSQTKFFTEDGKLAWKNDPRRNPALPIVTFPSSRIAHFAYVLKACILKTAPQLIKDRKYHLKTYESCLVGSEMVDWLINLSPLIFSRSLAIGMWQALLEEKTIAHVSGEHYFKDKYIFYRFTSHDEAWRNKELGTMEEQLDETIKLLSKIGPDATLRMLLRKPSQDRTANDLDIIYEELLHIKALSHFSSLVKKELAAYLFFEAHSFKDTVIFRQGDEATSWFIILKGSVQVSIYSKGVVTHLHEGEEFGKLGLVNNCPRLATVTTGENNCHFLRVEKNDFNRIIKDCEAYNIHLKEFDKTVLSLQKLPVNTKHNNNNRRESTYEPSLPTACYKYSITSGTPEKIFEHLLETRLLLQDELEDTSDTFVEDFLMTHTIFFPVAKLCQALLDYYKMLDNLTEVPPELMINNKKKVVRFIKEWCDIAKDAFYEDLLIIQLVNDIFLLLKTETKTEIKLREELKTLEMIIEGNPHVGSSEANVLKRVKTLWRNGSRDVAEKIRKPIRPQDENLVQVYFADHTFATVNLKMQANAKKIITAVVAGLDLSVEEVEKNNYVLCEVRSTGEKIVFKNNDVSINTNLSINGRYFISPADQLSAILPLPEQEGPTKSTFTMFELYDSREIAHIITQYDWGLFNALHPYELIYQVFGRHKFNKITANLDMFMRRFNEVQYWVCTELCLCQNIGKRVTLLRKFIKIAGYCKTYHNLNSFFAIVMGLSNVAVSRLTNTWEKLPNRCKKMFSEFEQLMDPSRNHRQYRVLMEQLTPPIIPFLPLILKDMTFTHEGNKTLSNGLVNFEKMRFLSATIRTMRKCRRNQLEIPIAYRTKYFQETKNYMKNLNIIDNQRKLTQLSHYLEPRRT